MNILYTILIFMALGFLLFYVLPALLPFLLIVFAFSVIRNFIIQRRQKKFFEETFENASQNQSQNYTYTQNQTRNSNPNVIDVEFTERDDED